MDTHSDQTEMAASVGELLPYLRRYARALTGSQTSGDAYAAAVLEAILADGSQFDRALSPKVSLFKTLHAIWKSSAGVADAVPESSLAAAAHRHMARLTADTREALLLSTIEEFRAEEVAQIMGISATEVTELVNIAHREMAQSIAGNVLIIEDEAIIAMDLESLVTEMGHKVTGVARTRDGAIKLAHANPPDLILADIQLADNSSGIDAVTDLLSEFGARPAIFITAFPERLLTGKRPEPAFLITKPYSEDQVRSSVAQAMFFASTETLGAP